MTSIRTRALESAVTLVGTDGVRALTHGRVDAAAGLPAGSTSNHFRTRAALVAGVIDWIAESERADSGPTTTVTDEQALVDLLVALIEIESGPRATRTRARYALFLETAEDDAAAPLRHQRLLFEEWVRALLTGIGGTEAARNAPMLMAACDGLLLHRITVDPGAPVRDSVALAVAAALRGPNG
ncbi:TetR/AcrR family transcriptional regulator [Microbacterium esteraromaticum]|uniref:TetR/AcrR family transcriptional regulator n=1 Tax=Microbacterium esteraromaticum TaxID=57043 RepID=UPI001C93BFF6|nr:TetR family transcriptional regulator [Microbacterium esteraromaticum]MBY6061701.1 TetR family transcriptional regulator [Microbacterium esteraromaticum]